MPHSTTSVMTLAMGQIMATKPKMIPMTPWVTRIFQLSSIQFTVAPSRGRRDRPASRGRATPPPACLPACHRI